MTTIRKLVLDVLKPHEPNAIDFCLGLASVGDAYQINLLVSEVDEKTETIVVTIEAPEINFSDISEIIQKMGASIHSIDEVDVCS